MSPFVTNRLILASYLIMALNSDQSFIEKAIHGDTRAYGFLVEKYQDYIFTIVLRILKVREEAEEVAQDTFLKAYEALPGFRGGEQVLYVAIPDSLQESARSVKANFKANTHPDKGRSNRGGPGESGQWIEFYASRRTV